jgi:hypothetical protein
VHLAVDDGGGKLTGALLLAVTAGASGPAEWTFSSDRLRFVETQKYGSHSTGRCLASIVPVLRAEAAGRPFRPDMPYLLSPYTLYAVGSGLDMVGLMRARGREAIARRSSSRVS